MIKYLAKFLISIVLMSAIYMPVNADWGFKVKDFILAKSKLSKIESWQKYIKQIDSILVKYDHAILRKLLSRISDIKPKLALKTDAKSEKLKAIVEYLEIATYFELQKWVVGEPQNIQTKNISTPLENNIELWLKYRTLGEKLYLEGKYKESFNAFEKSLTYNSKDFKAYYRMWNTHELLGEYNKAREDLLKAKELEPKYSYIFDWIIALSYAKENNEDKAQEYINKSLESNDEYYLAYHVQAILAKSNDNSEWVINYLKKEVDSYDKFFNNPQNKEISQYLLSVFGFSLESRIIRRYEMIWYEYELLWDAENAIAYYDKADKLYYKATNNPFTTTEEYVQCHMTTLKSEISKKIDNKWQNVDISYLDKRIHYIGYDFTLNKLEEWEYHLRITCWYLDVVNKTGWYVYGMDFSIDSHGSIIDKFWWYEHIPVWEHIYTLKG